jgi:hypothetical protein
VDTLGSQATIAEGAAQPEELERAMQGEHFTAPTALLVLGVVVNVALLLYVLVTDLQAPIGGETGAPQSVTVVCGVMLAIGLALYGVNNLAQRRLDRARAAGGGEGGGA